MGLCSTVGQVRIIVFWPVSVSKGGFAPAVCVDPEKASRNLGLWRQYHHSHSFVHSFIHKSHCTAGCWEHSRQCDALLIQHSEQARAFCSPPAWVQIPALPLTNLGKLLVSFLSFLICKTGEMTAPTSLGLSGELVS